MKNSALLRLVFIDYTQKFCRLEEIANNETSTNKTKWKGKICTSVGLGPHPPHRNERFNSRTKHLLCCFAFTPVSHGGITPRCFEFDAFDSTSIERDGCRHFVISLCFILTIPLEITRNPKNERMVLIKSAEIRKDNVSAFLLMSCCRRGSRRGF